ncbi:MAG TPA: aroma-sacti cluster domain-containing protein [Holophagaceae bacterium]|nr:aroma-sacti cluster domain-containing protein [Holophagaceae bacterium]
MTPSEKIQRLVNAGIIKGDPAQLTAEMQARLGALSDAEITHLISVKAQLGDDNLGDNQVCITL